MRFSLSLSLTHAFDSSLCVCLSTWFHRELIIYSSLLSVFSSLSMPVGMSLLLYISIIHFFLSVSGMSLCRKLAKYMLLLFGYVPFCVSVVMSTSVSLCMSLLKVYFCLFLYITLPYIYHLFYVFRFLLFTSVFVSASVTSLFFYFCYSLVNNLPSILYIFCIFSFAFLSIILYVSLHDLFATHTTVLLWEYLISGLY